MYVWQKIFIFSIFIPTTDVQIVYNRWKDFKQFDREEYINVPPSSRFLIIVDRIFEARSRNYNSSSCRACYKSLNNICHAIVATWPTNVENRVFPRRGEGIENLKTNDPLAGGGVKPRGRSTGKYPCRIVFFFSFRTRWRGQRRPAQKTSLRLRARPGSRCYLRDGRRASPVVVIPLTNYSTDPRLSTMRVRIYIYIYNALTFKPPRIEVADKGVGDKVLSGWVPSISIGGELPMSNRIFYEDFFSNFFRPC